MKIAKVLALAFVVWVLALLMVFLTVNGFAGAVVVGYTWPVSVGLGIASIIAYIKNKPPSMNGPKLSWTLYLIGVVVVLILISAITYFIFFEFSYR